VVVLIEPRLGLVVLTWEAQVVGELSPYRHQVARSLRLSDAATTNANRAVLTSATETLYGCKASRSAVSPAAKSAKRSGESVLADATPRPTTSNEIPIISSCTARSVAARASRTGVELRSCGTIATTTARTLRMTARIFIVGSTSVQVAIRYLSDTGRRQLHPE
jgi:hypothetical protein